MIKIKTKVVEDNDDITNVMMKYEVKNVELGEYLAILDKIKNEVLETTTMEEETLKEILFGKED